MEAADLIDTVDCFPVCLPLVKPLVMATYRIDDAPVLFIRIRTRSGAEGWGEAAPNPVMSGETLVGMVAAVNQWIRPWLVGERVSGTRRLLSVKLRQTYGNGGMKAAVDMALLDLEGHLLQVPAVALLGGPARLSVRVVRLIGSSCNIEKNLDEVGSQVAVGYSAFKLKVGMNGVKQDIDTVRQLRSRFGPEMLLGADANMGWDLRTARLFADGVDNEDLAFLEQPLAQEAIANLATLKQAVNVPISADEAIHEVADILALWKCHAIDGVGLKTNKLGGVTAVVDAGVVCDALGLSLNLAMMMESSLASSALVHAACAVPRLDWGLVLGNLSLAVDPVVSPLVCIDGHTSPPSGPGLGVQIDIEVLRQFNVGWDTGLS
jgi:muconate cycloisomerase